MPGAASDSLGKVQKADLRALLAAERPGLQR